MSLAYPNEPTYAEKRAAKDFFNSFTQLLPCPVCKEHFREVVALLPVDTWLDNRASLTEWVWMLHNRVNSRLGKREITMAEFHEAYKQMSERGLPIPPAAPTAELSEAAVAAAMVQGAAYTAVGIATVALVGGLLWASYKK